MILTTSYKQLNLEIIGVSAAVATVFVSVVLLIVSLYVFRCKKAEFLLQPAGVNPYKLVYKITHFARLHKFPLRRSAFTFCTEELPSRMDVGKRKFSLTSRWKTSKLSGES